MIRLSWAAFIVAEAGMLWIAFGWPLVGDPDPASPALRIAALTALFGFFASLVMLLVIRMRTQRTEA